MESLSVVTRASTRSLVAVVGFPEEPFSGTGPYPVFLEFGTRTMAARPFMRPSVDRFRKRYG